MAEQKKPEPKKEENMSKLKRADRPVSAKKIMIGKFNGLVLIFISRLAACFISHKNKASGIASQSKNCLLNSKYSAVQGKKS